MKYDEFVGSHDPSDNQMIQGGKSLLELEAHGSECDAVGKGDVPHHVPPHESPPRVSLDSFEHSNTHYCKRIRPWEQIKLIPPSKRTDLLQKYIAKLFYLLTTNDT